MPAYFADEQEKASFVAVNDCRPDECIVSLGELPQSFRGEIEKGCSTGWECLDVYLQGLRKGEVTVVTADTGAGKTTFCTQLVVNLAMQGVKAWVNSWEMRPEVTMRKLASVVLRKPMKIQRFTEEDSHQFNEWCRRYTVYINPHTIGIDINGLSMQLIRAKELGVQVVMLDHLDYLVNSRKASVTEAIDDTVKRLHELAFALEMHFLLICHPRQTLLPTEEVGMHSIKGSSSIKQYADNILILHRCNRTDPQAHPSKTKIRVTKNRMFGIEGTAYLFYEPTWDGYLQLHEFT